MEGQDDDEDEDEQGSTERNKRTLLWRSFSRITSCDRTWGNDLYSGAG